MKLLKLVPETTNIEFTRWRSLAMGISLLLIVASIALVAVRGLNLGVDFVGGQMVRVTFAQPVVVDELRETVDALGQGEPTIQQFGSPKDVSIRMPLPKGGEGAANAAAIPRLDIKGAKLIKGIHLEGLRVIGDPQEFSRRHYE